MTGRHVLERHGATGRAVLATGAIAGHVSEFHGGPALNTMRLGLFRFHDLELL